VEESPPTLNRPNSELVAEILPTPRNLLGLSQEFFLVAVNSIVICL
jgi:hypothetical protein